VGEQSHVEAMRAAIRGDFERLERRRGTQELMRISPAPTGATERDVEAPESPAPTASSPAPPRQSWLDRLLSR
jgi:hypothetical protein